MKTLRRPMFRKGGEVGGGIMTGVMRENYDEGTLRPSERITKVLEQFSEPAFDPVSQLLIQGGLNTMSQTGGGGLLGNVAKAFQAPTADFFKGMSKRQDVKRDIALEGVIADIGQDQKDEENRIKKELARSRSQKKCCELGYGFAQGKTQNCSGETSSLALRPRNDRASPNTPRAKPRPRHVECMADEDSDSKLDWQSLPWVAARSPTRVRVAGAVVSGHRQARNRCEPRAEAAHGGAPAPALRPRTGARQPPAGAM